MRVLRDEQAYRHYLFRKRYKLKHANRSQHITKYHNDIFIYRAGRPDDWLRTAGGVYIGKINNNGDFKDWTGKPIWCRHLAQEWLSRHKRKQKQSYHSHFRTQQHIRRIKNLFYNAYDNNDTYNRADRYILTDIYTNSFGHGLYQACKHLQPGNRVTMILHSGIHAMALVIEHKTDPNRYSIKFYDPNNTLVHIRAICQHLHSLKQLQLNDFLSASHIDEYFSNQQFATLLTYNQLATCKQTLREDSEIEYYACSATPSYSADRKACILSAKLYIAYNGEKSRSAIRYIDQLLALKSQLAPEKLAQYLEAKDTWTTPGLARLIEFGNRDSIDAVVKHIIHHQRISIESKAHLLIANNEQGIPAIFSALLRSHRGTVMTLGSRIQKSMQLQPSPMCQRLHKLATIAHATAYFYYHNEADFEVLHRIANDSNELNHVYALAKYIMQSPRRGAQAQARTVFQFYLSGNTDRATIFRFMNQTRGSVTLCGLQIRGIFGDTHRRKLLKASLGGSHPSNDSARLQRRHCHIW